MKAVVDRDGQPFPGKGFAIKPTSDKLYAQFDGKINFTFGTRHAFGITSDKGLENDCSYWCRDCEHAW